MSPVEKRIAVNALHPIRSPAAEARGAKRSELAEPYFAKMCFEARALAWLAALRWTTPDLTARSIAEM
jgi:hypothetical protein